MNSTIALPDASAVTEFIERAERLQDGDPVSAEACGEFVLVYRMKKASGIGKGLDGKEIIRAEQFRDNTANSVMDVCMVVSIGPGVEGFETGDIIGVITNQSPEIEVGGKKLFGISTEHVYAKFTYADD